MNSSQGGGSKDTWVLAAMLDEILKEQPTPDAVSVPPMLTRRPPDPGPPVGQQAAQQQQQQQ